MRKERNLVLGIVILLLFVSAHFLIGIYFKTRDDLMWIWSDIFLYLAIGLMIFLIVSITFSKTKTKKPKHFKHPHDTFGGSDMSDIFNVAFENLVNRAKHFLVKEGVLKGVLE